MCSLCAVVLRTCWPPLQRRTLTISASSAFGVAKFTLPRNATSLSELHGYRNSRVGGWVNDLLEGTESNAVCLKVSRRVSCGLDDSFAYCRSVSLFYTTQAAAMAAP